MNLSHKVRRVIQSVRNEPQARVALAYLSRASERDPEVASVAYYYRWHLSKYFHV